MRPFKCWKVLKYEIYVTGRSLVWAHYEDIKGLQYFSATFFIRVYIHLWHIFNLQSILIPKIKFTPVFPTKYPISHKFCPSTIRGHFVQPSKFDQNYLVVFFLLLPHILSIKIKRWLVLLPYSELQSAESTSEERKKNVHFDLKSQSPHFLNSKIECFWFIWFWNGWYIHVPNMLKENNIWFWRF